MNAANSTRSIAMDPSVPPVLWTAYLSRELWKSCKNGRLLRLYHKETGAMERYLCCVEEKTYIFLFIMCESMLASKFVPLENSGFEKLAMFYLRKWTELMSHPTHLLSFQTSLQCSMGIKGEVNKTRTLFIHERTRIHIDSVEGLGDFMELEVKLFGHPLNNKVVTNHLVTCVLVLLQVWRT